MKTRIGRTIGLLLSTGLLAATSGAADSETRAKANTERRSPSKATPAALEDRTTVIDTLAAAKATGAGEEITFLFAPSADREVACSEVSEKWEDSKRTTRTLSEYRQRMTRQRNGSYEIMRTEVRTNSKDAVEQAKTTASWPITRIDQHGRFITVDYARDFLDAVVDASDVPPRMRSAYARAVMLEDQKKSKEEWRLHTLHQGQTLTIGGELRGTVSLEMGHDSLESDVTLKVDGWIPCHAGAKEKQCVRLWTTLVPDMAAGFASAVDAGLLPEDARGFSVDMTIKLMQVIEPSTMETHHRSRVVTLRSPKPKKGPGKALSEKETTRMSCFPVEPEKAAEEAAAVGK